MLREVVPDGLGTRSVLVPEPVTGSSVLRIVFAGPVYRTENTHRTELD
jgi:hypothetical protein